MGQQIVGDLAGALTTGLNAAIPALLDNLNPMATIKTGAIIVGSFINPPKEIGASATNGNGAATTTPASSGIPPQALPPQTAGSAYTYVLKMNTFLSIIYVILNDKGGNIGWDMAAKGDESEQGAKPSIKFFQTMMQDHTEGFNSVVM